MARINPRWVVYALSEDGKHHRYVGYTGAPGLARRMDMHRWEARRGNPRQPYPWMREVGPGAIVAVVLEKLAVDAPVAELGAREKYWIAKLRDEGHDLVNLAAGGAGAPGLHLSPEARAKVIAGSVAYHTGRSLTPEHRGRLSEVRQGRKRGPYDWKDRTAQAISGGRAAHNRWHVARGVHKPGCSFCIP